MRILVLLCGLLPMPVSGQLSFSSAAMHVGAVPVGVERIVSVQLRNDGAAPLQLLGVETHDALLDLPAPPVTDGARWLAPGQLLVFPLSVLALQAGPAQGRLLARTVHDTALTLVSAEVLSVFISEVLADPAGGLPGDANGDGERQTWGDEFVELHNDGPDAVDITGWQLSDDDVLPAARFTFPSVSLAAGGFVVLFGGGAPAGIPPPVFVDDGRIGDGLSNAGDGLVLLTSAGDTIDVVHPTDVATASWPQDRSIVRQQRLDPWQPHDELPGVTRRFSPGGPAGGTSEAVVDSAGASAPGRAPATVLITEILADPPAGIEGDANGDGQRDTYADEFVELHNVASDSIDISAWSLSDDDTDADRRFRFPPGTLLAPGARAVLFGGGIVDGPRGFVDDGRIGNGLSNGGDVVILRNAAGDTVDAVFGSNWPADRATVRVPLNCPLSCDWQPHPGDNAYSPGTAAGTEAASPQPPPLVEAVRISEIFAAPSAPDGDANLDGAIDAYEDEFVELHNAGTATVDLSGWQLSDDDTAAERRFVFPPGTGLSGGERTVLFGGGSFEPGDVLVFRDDGRIGNGLTNSGDTVVLFDAQDRLVTSVTFSASVPGQSLLVAVDGTLGSHAALPGYTAFSPGAARPVYTGFSVDTLTVVLGRSAPEPVLRGLTASGSRRIAPDAVGWLALHNDVLVFDGSRPLPQRPGDTVVEAWLNGSVLARGPARVRQPSAANSAPTFISTPPDHAWVDGAFQYLPRAVDAEGTTLSFAPVQLPAWLSMDRSGGRLTGRAPSVPGSHQVVLQVTDGQGGLAIQRFDIRVRSRPRLRIAEVLADPPPRSAGDANRDGARQTWGDEFVEVVNDGSQTVRLDGWQISDASGRRPHTLPAGSTLGPGARLVVFGSDAGGRLGDGLGNLRDTVLLVDPVIPETLAVAAYQLSRRPAQSLRWPPGSGTA